MKLLIFAILLICLPSVTFADYDDSECTEPLVISVGYEMFPRGGSIRHIRLNNEFFLNYFRRNIDVCRDFLEGMRGTAPIEIHHAGVGSINLDWAFILDQLNLVNPRFGFSPETTIVDLRTPPRLSSPNGGEDWDNCMAKVLSGGAFMPHMRRLVSEGTLHIDHGELIAIEVYQSLADAINDRCNLREIVGLAGIANNRRLGFIIGENNAFEFIIDMPTLHQAMGRLGVFIISRQIFTVGQSVERRNMDTLIRWPENCSRAILLSGLGQDRSAISIAGREVFDNFSGARAFYINYPGFNRNMLPGMVVAETSGVFRSALNDIPFTSGSALLRLEGVAYANLYVGLNKAEELRNALIGTACAGHDLFVYFVDIGHSRRIGHEGSVAAGTMGASALTGLWLVSKFTAPAALGAGAGVAAAIPVVGWAIAGTAIVAIAITASQAGRIANFTVIEGFRI